MQATDQKHRAVYLCAVLLVLLCSLRLCAQTGTVTNHVLELDGTNSFVELPPNIFNDLTEATVEGWIKWNRLGSSTRFFDFGRRGNPVEGQTMAIGSGDGSSRLGRFDSLSLELWDASGVSPVFLHVDKILRTNEWCHISVATGPKGIRIFFDGVLVAQNDYTGSFAAIKSGARNYLGRNNWKESFPTAIDDLAGQMDEVRVWKAWRTEDQIRENMFKRLTGNEPGLVGLWNFDHVANGVVKDLSPGGHDGKLIGNARIAEASSPTAFKMSRSKQVLDLDGTNSYVELPPKLFTNSVVTVEGWVKWRKLGVYSRFFDFADASLQIGLNNSAHSATLLLERYYAPPFDDLKQIMVPYFLTTNEWIHLAVVAGTNFSKFYANGVMLSTNEVPDSFRPIPLPPLKNFLGRSVMKGNLNAASDTELNGQMAEVRIWDGERTAEQIKTNLFTDLTGREAGLLALWNFADGTPRDASGHGRDGKLIGNVRVVSAQLPASAQVHAAVVVFGTIKDETGKPVTNATIRLLRQEAEISTATSDTNGNYSTAFLSEYENFDIAATAGELGIWKFGVACPPGRRTELNLTLSNAVSIAGKVTAFDGSLVGDVIVQAVRADAAPREAGSLTTPGLAATVLTTTTNSEQGYRFLNLRPGEYKVRIHVPEGQLEYHHGEALRTEPGKTQGADFQIAPFRKGRWRRYSTANGLPGNRVYDLHFAPDGTLWLATQAGVSHFDGLKFTSLSERDGLIDNRVFCIHAGNAGALWFGTEKGASLFDTATGRFQNFPSGTNGLGAGSVFDIEATPDGVLWLRTREGLSRFNGQSFQEIPGFPGYSGGGALSQTRLWRSIRKAASGSSCRKMASGGLRGQTWCGSSRLPRTAAMTPFMWRQTERCGSRTRWPETAGSRATMANGWNILPPRKTGLGVK